MFWTHRLANLVFILALLWGASGTKALAQSSREISYARKVLSELQGRSIQNNREYCGYFGYNRQNQLVSGPIQGGGRVGCRPRWPDNDVRVVASFHTHGGFDPRTTAEVPSQDDVLADVADGNFGFVATPGGRLWLIDPRNYSVRQICGLGCLPQDAKFIRGITGPIQNSYGWAELERFYATR